MDVNLIQDYYWIRNDNKSIHFVKFAMISKRIWLRIAKTNNLTIWIFSTGTKKNKRVHYTISVGEFS